MNLFDWKGFLLLLVIFVPLERLIALHPEQKLFRKGWWNDLIYVAVNGWFIKAGTLTVVVLGLVAARAAIPPSWQEAVASQPWWLQLAEVLVIADAGFYLMHRAFHAVPWLWQFHAVHHSIEELDWLASSGSFGKNLIDYLARLRFTGDIHAMPEGTVFFPDEPILRVTAALPEAQLVETRLINLLQFQ